MLCDIKPAQIADKSLQATPCLPSKIAWSSAGRAQLVPLYLCTPLQGLRRVHASAMAPGAHKQPDLPQNIFGGSHNVASSPLTDCASVHKHGTLQQLLHCICVSLPGDAGFLVCCSPIHHRGSNLSQILCGIWAIPEQQGSAEGLCTR